MNILYKYAYYLSNYANTTKDNYLRGVKYFIRYLEETSGKYDTWKNEIAPPANPR